MRRKLTLSLVLMLLAFVSQACSLGARPVSGLITVPTVTQESSPADPASTPVPPLIHDPSTPRTLPTATLIFTPTRAPVTIKAVRGSLAIRSGPAAAFEAVAVLQDGQSAPVLARSIQDGWVQIAIPSQPGSLGWVYTNAGFSQVDGYVLDLPLITKVEWPFGAYLLNCTDHQVVVEPGDAVVPPVSAAPANRVWFTPGLYTAYDMDVSGRPAITQLKLWSHTTVNLTKDGNGKKYVCP